MVSRLGFRKAIAGAVLAGTLTLASLPGGVVSADGGRSPLGVGELQECTISKSMESAGTLNHDVDARDFLVWQRGPIPSSDRPTEEVAFYYNKIAFVYQATVDGR